MHVFVGDSDQRENWPVLPTLLASQEDEAETRRACYPCLPVKKLDHTRTRNASLSQVIRMGCLKAVAVVSQTPRRRQSR